MPIPSHWRWKLDRWRDSLKQSFGSSEKNNARPKMCPSCGSLAGTTATKCYNCGANLRFSVAAVSRSLSRMLPTQSPMTYAVLSLCCLFYGISLLLTLHSGGENSGGGGGALGSLFGIGGINFEVLVRMGASVPLPYEIHQPWRLVTACFLHGGLLHIVFNMWVLMDIGPIVEGLYGSARYLFLYIVTGAAGYVASSMLGKVSIGASGALLGLIGLLLAATSKRGNAAAQMLRSQLIRWVIYIFVIGFLPGMGIDNAAHFGGLAAGFLLGRIVADRQPADVGERKRAYALGWAAALIVVVCFGFMFTDFYQENHPANSAAPDSPRTEISPAPQEDQATLAVLGTAQSAGNSDAIVQS